VEGEWRVSGVNIIRENLLLVGAAEQLVLASFEMKNVEICLEGSCGGFEVEEHGIIWDLDGTLSNSFSLGFDATNQILQTHQYPLITEDQYQYGTRFPTQQRMAWHATGNIEDEIGKSLGNEFDLYYIALVDSKNTKLYPEINSLLDQLHFSSTSTSRIKMCILSNASSAYVQRVVSANHMEQYFESWYGIDDVLKGKPHPSGLEKIIQELKLQKSQCLYIGDSPSDGQAAKACGIYSIGVTWGHSSNDLLQGLSFLSLS
jgi:phosphoglycolate phosphatase